MSLRKFSTLVLLAIYCFVSACSKDNEPEPEHPDTSDESMASAIVQKVNNYIYGNFIYNYLWNETVSWDVDIRYIHEPFVLFDSLLNKQDNWSFLADDVEKLMGEVTGEKTTFGYSWMWGQFSGSENCFAIICFVYPGSPAEKAGLKRGDILLKTNGEFLNRNNLQTLDNASSLKLELGIFKENTISLNGISIQMTPIKMYENPINTDTVIVKGEHRIGYLCYTGYMAKSNPELGEVFADFKAKQVTDVVLDLRYNSGGDDEASRYLCSILAPASAVSGKKVYLQDIWNDYNMKYCEQYGIETKSYFDPAALPFNMNLSQLYILTGNNTASASEATITALKPYIDKVTLIGEKTSGKYCGGSIVLPYLSNSNTIDPEIKNWAMYLILFRFANCTGEIDFANGFVPDYPVNEDLFNAYPLGDIKDPLLAKALELITGTPMPVSVKSSAQSVNLPALRMSSQKQGEGFMIKPEALETLKLIQKYQAD